MMSSRPAFVVALAVVSASLASYGAFLVARQSRVPAGPTLAPVVVAARPVAMGALLTAEDVKVTSWPADARPDGSFGRIEDVLERSAVSSLVTHEPLVAAKLAAKGSGAGLLPSIAPGMRAISIRVDEVIGVAGFVLPGTHVDVLVTVKADQNTSSTHLVVGDVQVLSAGTRIDQTAAKEEGVPIATSVVTLMVTPQDAERVALAQVEGRLTLTLRNPLDTTPTPGAGTRLTQLTTDASRVDRATTSSAAADRPPLAAPSGPTRRSAAAAKPESEPPARPPAPEARSVDAIRGAKRTEEQVK